MNRIAATLVALAMGATLFAGLPGPARASGTEYVAVSGRTYAGAHAADCNGTAHKTDGTNDEVQVQDAFDALEGAGDVRLCAGTYRFGSQVEATGEFVLWGDSAATTIVDGGGVTRLFKITGWIDVHDLTLQNAHSTDAEGGAIQSSLVVTVYNSIFRGNLADKGGAAIAILAPSAEPVYVTNSVFEANVALDQGGAIATYGIVSVTDSTFTENVSIADENCVGGGGAIAAGNDVYVVRSTFTRNAAAFDETTNTDNCGSEGESGGFGGAIATYGLEFVTDSTFSNNSAAAAGGAIAAWGYAPTEDTYGTVYGSSFAGNDVTIGLNHPPITGGFAIVNYSLGLQISGSSFTGNGHRLVDNGMQTGSAVLLTTYYECAGLLEVLNSSFTGNFGIYGGALAGCSMHVVGSTFTANSALFTGGAITGDALAIESSTFVGNSSTRGGAVWFCDSSTVSNSTFVRNRAVQTGNSGTGLAGALGGYAGLTVTSSTFRVNRADRAGGAIWLGYSAEGALTALSKNRFVGNRARYAGGAIGFDSHENTDVSRKAISGAYAHNRFSSNTAARGTDIGGWTGN